MNSEELKRLKQPSALIPEGWRELEYGEIVLSTDKYWKKSFKAFCFCTSSVGYKYRVNTDIGYPPLLRIRKCE